MKVDGCPSFTPAQERALSKRIARGDEAAINALAESQLPELVRQCNLLGRQWSVRPECLMSDGWLAARRAAERWRPRPRGGRFLQYARTWIRGAVVQSCAQQAQRAVSVPRRQKIPPVTEFQANHDRAVMPEAPGSGEKLKIRLSRLDRALLDNRLLAAAPVTIEALSEVSGYPEARLRRGETRLVERLRKVATTIDSAREFYAALGA